MFTDVKMVLKPAEISGRANCAMPAGFHVTADASSASPVKAYPIPAARVPAPLTTHPVCAEEKLAMSVTQRRMMETRLQTLSVFMA